MAGEVFGKKLWTPSRIRSDLGTVRVRRLRVGEKEMRLIMWRTESLAACLQSWKHRNSCHIIGFCALFNLFIHLILLFYLFIFRMIIYLFILLFYFILFVFLFICHYILLYVSLNMEFHHSCSFLQLIEVSKWFMEENCNSLEMHFEENIYIIS